MKVLYELLPEKERQAAEEHAKRLLRTTDATPNREFFGTVRDALDTEYKRTKNVVAVLVYDDGHGTWWSDVVFRKGKHKLQCGISCTSEQQAIACLERQIAEIKATRRHPLVAEGRRLGVNYDACLWLGVQHKELGYRYVKRRIDEIRSDGFEFLRKHGIAENAGEAEMRHAETLARDTVLLYAPHFNSPDYYPTLEPPADTDKSEEEIKTWQEAASFLLGRGIPDINNDGNEIDKMWKDAAAWLLWRLDNDEIEDGQHEPVYWHVLCVPDKTASVVTTSGLQKASSTAPLNSPA